MSKNEFFPNVTDPDARRELIAGFFAASGVPDGDADLAAIKESMRLEKAIDDKVHGVDAPAPSPGEM